MSAELKALGMLVLIAIVWAAWDDRRWLTWIRRKLNDPVLGTFVDNPSKDVHRNGTEAVP